MTPGLHEVGGAAKRSRLLARGLSRRGWDVRVITRTGSGRWLRVRREPNLVVVEVPGFGAGRLGALPFALVGIPLSLVWGRRAHAFLAVQLMSTTTVAGTCAIACRRPWFAATTTSGALGESAYISSRRSSGMRVRLLRRATAVIAQTPVAAREVAALVPEATITVVPNPVEVPAERPPLTGLPRAMFSGRFSDEKDLPRLLDAWRAVAQDEPAATLTLVGHGGDHRSVEAAVRAQVAHDPVLTRSVTFTGWVADVTPHLVAHDVYVFPSRSEGMSNSLLEACAHGRVCVVSDIDANKAVVGEDYPLLFSAGDTGDLERTLRIALHEQVPRTAAVEHLAARMRSFSTDTVLDRLEELLHAAARGPRHQLS